MRGDAAGKSDSIERKAEMSTAMSLLETLKAKSDKNNYNNKYKYIAYLECQDRV